MNILYDGWIYHCQTAGGINRYFENIIARLPDSWRATLTSTGPLGVNTPRHPNLRLLRWGTFRPRRFADRIEPLALQLQSLGRRFSLQHPTYYHTFPGSEWGRFRTPTVITVWDMIHERFPRQLDPSGSEAAQKGKAIRAAAAIICISESTRRDLLELYPECDNKATTIPLAASIATAPVDNRAPVPDRPYFLYVGSRAWYKNFGPLLGALQRLRSTSYDFGLCVVGPPLDSSETATIAAHGLADLVTHYTYPPDGHLARLYQRSLALVYPSLYEGFGIPPLEAMSCGTAVIAANTSSIPETVGSAALLFDPDEPEGLTNALLRALSLSASERRQLTSAGAERARMFSWDKTAAQTIALYRAVAGG